MKAGTEIESTEATWNPITGKRPPEFFVAAHSELFGEGAPDSAIDWVFAVMALADWHRFQVLRNAAAVCELIGARQACVSHH